MVIADGAVDRAATDALRAKMRNERGAAVPLFNYGPSIHELRSRSQADTGLPAPVQPRWTRTETPLSITAE